MRRGLTAGVTAPRQVLPNTTYLVTRRCSRREFLLRPSPKVNQTFLYVLALGAERYRVDVHAFCVMSNHVHLVVTDPTARLPAFLQFVHGQVAKALNALHRRSDSFWESGSYNAVTLVDSETIVEKVAYTLANPVTEGLVRTGSLWPGLWSAPARIGGKPFVGRKPSSFFDPLSALPERVELQLKVPPGFENADAFRAALAGPLACMEEAAIERYGPRFLGVAAVLAQRPTQRPIRPEPRERRGIEPRIAGRDLRRRVAAIQRLRSFLDDYRDAYRARRAGKREVLFPRGTYQLRVAHGVACASG